MDIEKLDVQAAEDMAPDVRRMAIKSGDEKLIRLIRTLPDESMVSLRNILGG